MPIYKFYNSSETNSLTFQAKNHVVMDRVVTSGNLGDVMVITLAGNTRDVGSISAPSAMLTIFRTPTTLSTTDIKSPQLFGRPIHSLLIFC